MIVTTKFYVRGKNYEATISRNTKDSITYTHYQTDKELLEIARKYKTEIQKQHSERTYTIYKEITTIQEEIIE